jgi:uncharacterized protein (TIRG00374 family)
VHGRVNGAGNSSAGRRAVGILVAKIALSVGLMAFLISRIPLTEVTESLRGARSEWLAFALLLFFASNILGSYQWNQLLHAVGIRIPFWKVCSYYHVGLFFNNFLPANIGGDIMRVADASRYGPSRGTAISTVLMDRIIATVALAGVALITTLPALKRFHFTMIYLALVGFFLASLLLVWAIFHPRVLPAVMRLLSRIGFSAFEPHLTELALRLQHFRGSRRLLLGVLVVAIVVQLARVGVHVLVARSLGLTVPTIYFFLFVPLLAVIVSLPISLNGIGVREGAGILLFGLVGVDRAHAFSLQFTTYLVAVAISLLGGLVFVARIPRRKLANNLRRSS